MISEILAQEEIIARLKGESNAGIKSNARNDSEMERLKKELEKKDRDLQMLKKQAAGNNRAYDALAEEHSKVTARPGEVKKEL